MGFVWEKLKENCSGWKYCIRDSRITNSIASSKIKTKNLTPWSALLHAHLSIFCVELLWARSSVTQTVMKHRATTPCFNSYSYLESIVRPTTEFENAGLFVKRKILNVNFTGGLVNGWWLPLDQTLMVDGGLGGQRHLKVPVRAARESTTTSNRNNSTATTAEIGVCWTQDNSQQSRWTFKEDAWEDMWYKNEVDETTLLSEWNGEMYAWVFYCARVYYIYFVSSTQAWLKFILMYKNVLGWQFSFRCFQNISNKTIIVFSVSINMYM